MGDHPDSILPGGENEELVACVCLALNYFWEKFLNESKFPGKCGIQKARRQGGMCGMGTVGHTPKRNQLMNKFAIRIYVLAR